MTGLSDPDIAGLERPEVPHPLTVRRDSAQLVLEEAAGKPLRMGRHDCLMMVSRHLARLGRWLWTPPSGSYRTLRGAMRELKKRGHASLGDFLTSQGLEEIAPAFAIVGDVVELPGELATLGALTVALGNGRVAGFYDDGSQGIVVMQPAIMIRAWRAIPLDQETVWAAS